MPNFVKIFNYEKENITKGATLDKEKAIKAFDRFTKLYEAKFPKAVECLLKTKDKTLAFYDFPAEHWRHIRTTRYDELLEAIRKSPVKHADETTWRVEGINHWLWGFFTEKEAYYTIHESRGRGVPQKALAGSHPQDVLIRDDYGGYKKLPFNHQSCWAHLLRKSHEAAVYPNASLEVITLHGKLTCMYNSVDQINSQPFVLKKRKMAYKIYSKELQAIIETKYQAVDAKKIQTRIANQNTNLLTALIFENVPITNNRAEQGIRPMVVTRKISGGSRSPMVAKTHAVQMSILQSNLLQKKPLIQTYKNLLNDHLAKN